MKSKTIIQILDKKRIFENYSYTYSSYNFKQGDLDKIIYSMPKIYSDQYKEFLKLNIQNIHYETYYRPKFNIKSNLYFQLASLGDGLFSKINDNKEIKLNVVNINNLNYLIIGSTSSDCSHPDAGPGPIFIDDNGAVYWARFSKNENQTFDNLYKIANNFYEFLENLTP